MSDSLDSLYLALANPKRRGMILTLSYRPATVSQLAQEHDLSLPAIDRHIQALEDAGLIQRRKVGRTNFVAIRRAGLLQAQEWFAQFHAYWGTDEETLENYVSHLN
jgi:DNA-binding transcriptional ArsR family regulator